MKGRRNGDGGVSESKPDESVEQDSLDELDALRAEHALSSSAMGPAAEPVRDSTRNRLFAQQSEEREE